MDLTVLWSYDYMYNISECRHISMYRYCTLNFYGGCLIQNEIDFTAIFPEYEGLWVLQHSYMGRTLDTP